jgi:hypothetical protein
MATFQDRISEAFKEENERRLSARERKLTKSDLWSAAGRSSGAATKWFNGENGAEMDACLKIAPLLRINPYWLFDESREKNDPCGNEVDGNVVKYVSETSAPPYIHPNETTRKIIALLDGTDEAGRGMALGAVMTALKDYESTQKTAA